MISEAEALTTRTGASTTRTGELDRRPRASAVFPTGSLAT